MDSVIFSFIRLVPSADDQPSALQLGGNLAHGAGLDSQHGLQLLLTDGALIPENSEDLSLAVAASGELGQGPGAVFQLAGQILPAPPCPWL